LDGPVFRLAQVACWFYRLIALGVVLLGLLDRAQALLLADHARLL